MIDKIEGLYWVSWHCVILNVWDDCTSVDTLGEHLEIGRIGVALQALLTYVRVQYHARGDINLLFTKWWLKMFVNTFVRVLMGNKNHIDIIRLDPVNL